MATIVTADNKHRICIKGAQEGSKYLVAKSGEGWWVTPHRESPPFRNGREWAGSKKSLDEHLQALADLGFSFEASEASKQKVGPCPF